jgi:hypothetical protein
MPPEKGGNLSSTDGEALTASNQFIENELCNRLCEIEQLANADTITCIFPIQRPFDDFIRNMVEDIDQRRQNLLVILETDGGSIETTERIADVFRYHYHGEISFLIPNFAMSAGTILVMSGDRILMDYYSILGPIDPQMLNADGQYVPALGYLIKFEELVRKSKRTQLSHAELAFLLDKFDPAQLHQLEQAREHAVDLLKQWLVKYKFKNWDVTETRGIPVTEAMKIKRAKEIAEKLNNTRLWRSHGRGISMDVIGRNLNLKVEDFGSLPHLADLNRAVRSYYRLTWDYMQRRGIEFVIHTRKGLFGPWSLR